MKSIATKTDNNSTLPAAAFNSMADEMENVVTDSGQTLDSTPEEDADPAPSQISKALGMASRAADFYSDTGSANTCTLTKVGSWRSETTYRDGAKFRFKPAATNTGATTVNIQSIGSKAIRFADNSALTAGALQQNVACEIVYDASADNFKLSQNQLATGATQGLYKAGNAPGHTSGVAIASPFIGQILTATLSDTTMAVSNTVYTVTGGTITLTPGVWMVFLKLSMNTPGTTLTQFNQSISTTLATHDLPSLVKDQSSGILNARYLGTSVRYFNVSSNTPVYAIASAEFTGSTNSVAQSQSQFFAVRVA